MKGKILLILLSCLLLIQALPFAVYAESGTCGDNVTWLLDDGVLTISGSGDMDDLSAEIPWFHLIPSIQKIIIKDGITSVSEKAFEACLHVTTVSLPEGLVTIGKMAFAGLRETTEIVIPNGVETISAGAFMDCVSLRSITLPTTLKEINQGAFSNCAALSDIYYQGSPQQWAEIKIGTNYGGNDALLNAELHYSGGQGQQQTIGGEFGDGLTWKFQDDTLTIQGDGDFRYGALPWVNFRNSIIHIRVGDGVTAIRRGAFSGCRNLQDITLPDSITSIGDEAFFGCRSITEITLSDHITHIGGNAFSGCTNLTSIRIPNSLSDISECAFYRCDRLTDVFYNGSESDWKNIDIQVMNGALTSADIHFVGSQTYIVFFNANGGAASVNSMEVVNGQPYGANGFATAIWEGHTFLGWFTAATGGTRITAQDTVNLSSDQILYAHWENSPTVFTVTLDACGGTVYPGIVTVTAGGKYDHLPVPVQGGYSFEGWFTSTNGGKKISSSTTVTLTADQTLYAHWTPNRSSPEIGDLSYDFENYSTELPKKYFETFFGQTQKATEIYNQHREAGGVCYGFATSTGMFYHANNELSPSLFRSGATKPSQLKENDYNPDWGIDVKSFIEMMYVSQLTDEIQYVRKTSVNNVAEMCDAVNYFQSTGLNPVYVRITGRGGGHALIGYRLVEISDRESHLMIYDCNYPDNGDLYIRLYKDSSGKYTNEWDYEPYHWGSSYGGDIGYIPYSEYYGVWQKYVMGTSPADMDNVNVNMETLTVNVGDASIYDSGNNLCAVLRDGELRSYRQDIYPLEVLEMIPMDNIVTVTEGVTYTICVPSDDYTVTNDNVTTSSFELVMMDKEQSASVTTSASEITLHVSDRDQLNCIQIDQPGKSFSITLNSTLPNTKHDIRLNGTTSDEMLSVLQVSGEVRLSGVDANMTVYVDGELRSAAELKGRIPIFNLDFGADNAGVDSADASRFRDVSSNAYYSQSVDWAYQNGITTGISDTEFGPYDNCTRAQVVTFLWRTMGRPEPSSNYNPFADVLESDYYYKAVLWAVEKGITTGTDTTSFAPSEICSRAHIVTFLYRAFGEPGKTGVGNWWEDALAWANANGLFDGTGVVFTSGADCPRGDVVYYLWKAFV